MNKGHNCVNGNNSILKITDLILIMFSLTNGCFYSVSPLFIQPSTCTPLPSPPQPAPPASPFRWHLHTKGEIVPPPKKTTKKTKKQ